MTERRPLDDIRIVAIEQYGAGPWGTVHLADLGADVIKIEDPRLGGDIGRYIPPYQSDQDSLFFQTLNRNKRSLSLDLQVPEGRQVFEDLVRVSDAVYSNLRGDVPQRLGIRYQDLAHLNPRIVCCSLSGFGMDGPRRAEPGYDYVMQGLAGWMSLTGEPGGAPEKTGPSLVDFSGGYVAALALMIGVHAARRDGVGGDCDVSLFETALSMLNYLATWHLTRGHTPERTRHSAHPSLVPFQNFETADGWIVISCPKEKFLQRFLTVIGMTELLDDARFTDYEGRRVHREPFLAAVEAQVRTWGSQDLLSVLAAAGVPCAPVNDLPEAMRDPQVLAREMVVRVDHPEFGEIRQLASPVRVAAGPSIEYRRAPKRNEDAAAILTKLLGYDDGHVASLQRAGAFGADAGELI